MRSEAGWKVFSLLFAIVVVLIFENPLWTDVDGATHTLKVQGYKPIHVGGYAWFAAEDGYKTKFRAIAPNGEEVTGVVTRGIFFKSNTVRID